ncbi:MAG: sulfatase, partial [Akkermansiaceae bacterium]|nr:sulfatase [Akkermansiaceae bacterium]
MNPLHEHRLALTRRHFFRQGGMGLGAAALGHLLGQDAMAAAPGMKAAAGLPHLPHFAPKAKRAIYLFMSG